MPIKKSLPIDFGLHGHDEFRPGQLEAIRFIQNCPHDTALVEAPTGSGKSAIGVALGHHRVVRILTETKSLQYQYAEQYGADELYGIANYDCAENHPFDAGFCSYSHNMYKCPSAKNNLCTYLNERRIVQGSRVQALSYAYYLTADWVTSDDYPADYLYCDEAHGLPELVMDHMSLKLTRKDIDDLDIDLWPTSFRINSPYHRQRGIMKWLDESRGTVTEHMNYYAEKVKFNLKLTKKIRYLRDIRDRMAKTSYLLATSPDATVLLITEESLKIVPLTASLFFRDLFSKQDHKTVLTSATLGDPQSFASALGIPAYGAMEVPSNFPSSAMPVYVPKAPKMSMKSGDPAKNEQARIISRLIGRMDPSWNGLIHVSSKKQAFDLAGRLARMGLQDRVFTASLHLGTEGKMAEWKHELQKRPNLVNISWTSHMGVDAWFSQFNIIAKIPFPMLDKVGTAKMKYDPKYYKWQAAVMTMQAAGRVRRGLPEHYEEDGEPMRKFVAIVDGNVYMLRKFYSKHFNDCIVKV